MLFRILATDPAWAPTIARILLGVIFFAHGSQKVFGWFGGAGLRQTLRTLSEFVGLPSIIALAAVGAELIGGAALILGFIGRISALGIVVNMLAAIFMVHGRYGLFLNWFGDRKGHGIEYHLLAIALAIVIIAKGAGALSLDGLRRRPVPWLLVRQKEAESSPSGLTPRGLFSLSRNRVFHSIDEAVQCGRCAFNIKMLILPGPAFC